MNSQQAISNKLKISLDAARGMVTVYVVLCHALHTHYFFENIAFKFSQEAVIVFFLLSGFLIFANDSERLDGWYYYRRARRIYPALLIALMLSTVVSFDNGQLGHDFSFKSLILNLLCVQDLSALKPGVIADPYLINTPLWTLSYEVFFYLIFPLVHRAWRRNESKTNHALGIVCVCSYLVYAVYPNHWALAMSYFSIWWLGAMAANAYLNQGCDFRSVGWPFAWHCVLILGSVLVVFLQGFRGPGFYPFLMTRHFLFAAIALMVFYSDFGRLLTRLATPGARVFAFLASISYGLYVLHYPLLMEWNRARGWYGRSVAFALVIGLSLVADRWLNQRLPRGRLVEPPQGQKPLGL